MPPAGLRMTRDVSESFLHRAGTASSGMEHAARYRRRLPEAVMEEIASYIAAKEALLAPRAARNSDAVRRFGKKPADIRTEYSRDADRIIHTMAYARYIDKSQVFWLVNNDHITHRVLHVQLVSKIARTIGRSLRLNEDLIEAIALGHDIGHIPYGHLGEACLSELCEKEGLGPFRHNVQSVRALQVIEDCDLTLQVLDGILCHNGEAYDDRIEPEQEKTWEALDDAMADGRDHAPMTLEGCAVRFADTIAYIGRDIQDAVLVGLIEGLHEIPRPVQEVLGGTNAAIIDTLIKDVIEGSSAGERPLIAYSNEAAAALAVLKEFNYRRIYLHSRARAEIPRVRRMYETVFFGFLDDLVQNRKRSKIFSDFIDAPWIAAAYRERATEQELVRDFIAGMTDRYFERRFRDFVLPRKAEGKFAVWEDGEQL
ncbi:putative dntp triphosphohydrolase [hydrocarbon metagenome]|uniref:Putative dntp triphosphohydrolase n=1 Tax=hydrocarbon metagenome TaxID=938273 RepID=A0A0W8FGL0_9ZZZZ